MSDTAIGKNQIVYAKAETEGFGTPAYPEGTDVVLVTGDGSFKQVKSKAADLQLRPTLSRLPGISGPYEIGEFTFPCYIKPAGNLGIAPKGGQFLKALCGKETIAADASVTYSLGGIDDALRSLTAIYKHGHIVYFNFGVLVNGGELPVEAGLSDSAIGAAVFSGQFLRQKVAGVTNIDFANGYMGSNDFPDHWAGTTVTTVGDRVIPTTANLSGYLYECTASTGSTGGAEPTWPTTLDGTVTDGDVTWTCEKVSNYQGIWEASTAYTLGEIITPTVSNDYWYECTTPGTSDTTEPGTWGTVIDGETADGATLKWTCRGLISNTSFILNDATIINDETKVEFQLPTGEWENNGDAGYLVSSSTIATNIIVITPALAEGIADDAEIRGHVPVAVDAGVKVHGRYGTFQENIAAGGFNTKIIAKANISIKNNTKIINEEKTNTGYPVSAVKAANRELKINIEEIVKKGFAKYIYHSNEQSVFGVKLEIGKETAFRYRIEANQVEFATPDLSGAEEVMGSREGDAYASVAYDDELTIIFD